MQRTGKIDVNSPMSSFAKKSKAGSQNAHQNASKPKRPFFDQSHTPDPFFRKQPETRQADRGDSEMGDKNLRRLDFSEITRPPSTARLRVPSSAELQGMLSSGSVNEAVVLSRVRKLLERMYREDRLKIKKHAIDLDQVIKELFPLPGVLDKKAYERYIDTADRKMVYKAVQDAFTTPHSDQQPDLKKGFAAAADMAKKVSGDSKGLKRVFGSKSDEAKSNYESIQNKLKDLTAKIGSESITTDYNGDSEESHVGGWASNQHLHLSQMAVSDPLLPRSKRTFIHEAAHLANEKIGDIGGYMGSTEFVLAEETTKLNNAAHYEVLPCVQWEKSCPYKNKVFKPASVNPPSADEQVKAAAEKYCDHALDAALDFFVLMKEVYTKQSVYNKDELTQKMMNRPMLTVSRLMELTLHKQKYPPTITLLDVATVESVARIVGFAIKKVVAPETAPDPSAPGFEKSLEKAAKKAAEKALVDVGGILGDPARDIKLLTWLHDHYQRIETSF